MELYEKGLSRILIEMERQDRRAFLELTYMAITSDPQFAISLDCAATEEKLKQLQRLVDFFSGEERYEECVELMKIIKEIEKNEREY